MQTSGNFMDTLASSLHVGTEVSEYVSFLRRRSSTFPLRSSSVSTYRECPKKAYYLYIEGLRIPPSPSMAVGTATHETNAWMLRPTIENKPLPTLEEVQDTARDQAQKIIGEVDFHGEQEEKAPFHDRVVALSSAYRESVAPDLQPLEVETLFELEVNGLPLTGTLDLLSKDGIHDTKTTRMTPPRQGDPKHLFQMGFYGLAKPHATSATLDYLQWSERSTRATKANGGIKELIRTVKHVPVRVPQSVLIEESTMALQSAQYVYEETQAGRFPRNPSACTSSWGRPCQFMGICMPWRASIAEHALIQNDSLLKQRSLST